LGNTERVVWNTVLSVTCNTKTEFAFLAEEFLFVGIPIESDTKSGDFFGLISGIQNAFSGISWINWITSFTSHTSISILTTATIFDLSSNSELTSSYTDTVCTCFLLADCGDCALRVKFSWVSNKCISTSALNTMERIKSSFAICSEKILKVFNALVSEI